MLNPKHSAGECLRGICQSPASLEGHVRPRSVRIAKSEPLCSLTLGSDCQIRTPAGRQVSAGDLPIPRELEGYVRSRSVRIAKSEHFARSRSVRLDKSEHSAGECLRGFANPPRAWKGLAEHERLCPPTLGSDCQIRTLGGRVSAGDLPIPREHWKGMPAHARFGLPNPNTRQVSVCGGFANPPRAWKGLAEHERLCPLTLGSDCQIRTLGG
ncbi:hypothetical protein QUF72_09535 [Desulfobacterales bacterium HSG2]|nr:hypothetical protein [Desulfobacterales bacterium HSG2]